MRQKSWDVLKGISIILVLIGHCVQYMSLGELDYSHNYVYLFIYSFHMPLFAFISGYFFGNSIKKYSFSMLIKKQFRILIVPLVIWNTIFYFFWRSIHVIQGRFQTMPWLKGWLYSMKGLWFLSALFISSAVVLAVETLVRSMNIIRILVYACVWTAFLCFDLFNATAFVFPYFVIGLIYNRNISSIGKSKRKYLYVICSGMVWMVLFFIPEKVLWITQGIGSSTYKVYGFSSFLIGAYKYLIGISGVFTIVNVKDLISDKMCRFAIDEIGKYTLEIYILQSMFVESILPTTYKMIVERIGVNFLVRNVYIYTIVSIILGIVMTYVIENCIVVLEKKFIMVKKVLFAR